MKRIIGLIVFGLGVAFLVAAPLFRFYVTPKVAVAPLNQYTVSTGVGVANKMLNIPASAAAGKAVIDSNVALTNTRYTKGDVTASQQNPAKSQNLAIYDTFSRIDTPTGLLTASSSRYAFNRTTSVLSNCCGANSGGQTVNFTGVMPLKFPFFVGKQTYQIWNDSTQSTVPAVFVDAENHAGISSYKFQQDLPATKVPGSDSQVPAKLAGQPGAGNISVAQYVAFQATLWIEPLTGQIIDSSVHQTQSYRGADGATDLVVIVDANFSGQPAYVAQSAKTIKSLADQLNLVKNILPIVFLILGIILIAVGFFVQWKGFKEQQAAAGTDGSGPNPEDQLAQDPATMAQPPIDPAAGPPPSTGPPQA